MRLCCYFYSADAQTAHHSYGRFVFFIELDGNIYIFLALCGAGASNLYIVWRICIIFKALGGAALDFEII